MNKPIQIILVNHGRFGEELIHSAELITGKMDNIKAVSLLKGMSIEDLMHVLEAIISSYIGDTIILTDMYGGTPSNVAMMLQQKYNLHVLCGMNLPMLLELLLTRENGNLGAEELVMKALTAGQQAVMKPERIIVDDDFEG